MIPHWKPYQLFIKLWNDFLKNFQAIFTEPGFCTCDVIDSHIVKNCWFSRTPKRHSFRKMFTLLGIWPKLEKLGPKTLNLARWENDTRSDEKRYTKCIFNYWYFYWLRNTKLSKPYAPAVEWTNYPSFLSNICLPLGWK